jgi:hypothetical protein
MYAVRGIYKEGRIIPVEPVAHALDGIEVIITFLNTEHDHVFSQNSDDEILYTMGDRAGSGNFTDASECHDKYLYGK